MLAAVVALASEHARVMVTSVIGNFSRTLRNP